MDNEVMELIDQLYTMVSEAWGVPLGNEKCIVERDQVLEILDEIKTAMPVELSEAKRLVSARDEFINNAKREAEGIRNQAEERARALVNDQEIVRIAKARSNEMLASTQAKADALRQASSQFCVDALRRTEEAISAALGSVQQAHAAFQHIRTAAGLPGGGFAFCRKFFPHNALPVFPAGAFSRFGGISCAAISFFRRETQSLVTGKTTVESPEMSEIARNGREFLLAIFPSCHYNEDTVWGEVV